MDFERLNSHEMKIEKHDHFKKIAATAAATFLTIISDVSIFLEERHKNVGFFASRYLFSLW